MTTVPEASASAWSKLSDFVAAQLGLHFPPARQPDLRRGLQQAARELGFGGDEQACLRALLAQPARGAALQALANQLTVGETYFFRDQPALEALASDVLPRLVRERRGRRQQLRLWCAACCTGEEAYTLAILLHRLLPDLAQWDVSLLATDVNTRFLEKARAGRYGEWSFRDAPPWLRTHYFERHADGSATVRPEIRRLVRFETLNLAHPAPGFGRPELRLLDVVICRNALMYFTAPQAARVVGELWQCLGERGWLLTAPGEASGGSAGRFEPVSYPGAILLRKCAEPAAAPPWAGVVPPPGEPAAAKEKAGQGLTAQALPQIPAPVVLQFPASELPPVPAWARQARLAANRGDLAEALACCDAWVAADKLDAAAHHLRGIVLWEQGDAAGAQAALQRAVYLDGGFVLAHFALGQLARAGGDVLRAGRHFARALRLLQPFAGDEPLPGSDELTAGRLRETLRSLTMQPEGATP